MNEHEHHQAGHTILQNAYIIGSILNSITDGVFFVDNEWNVIYWNEAAEHALNCPRSKVLGKNLWDVFDDAIELIYYSEAHTAKRTGETRKFEAFYPGAGIWTEAVAYPSKEGLAVYFKDITSRKKLEMELTLQKKQQDAMINAAAEVMWSVDKTYHLLAANKTFFELACRQGKPGIHLGDEIRHLIANSEGIDWFSHYENCFSGNSFKVTTKGMFDGTALRCMEINFNPIRHEETGEVIGAACAARDITQLVQVEEKRNQLLDRLRKKNTALKEIAFLQSHEVRRPVANILGLIALLQHQHRKEDIDESLTMLNRSAEELDGIIKTVVEKTVVLDKSKVVFIVDDDIEDAGFIHNAMQQNLEQESVDFELTHNGIQLINKLEQLKKQGTIPHLIILDINMPLLNGVQALQQIKKDVALSKIPVVIFTSSASIEDEMVCIDLGCALFVRKPNDIAAYKDVARELILLIDATY